MHNAAAILEELLRTIVRSIARHTPAPVIQHIEDQATFSLQVDGEDQGRFIGKNGSTIWAIQTIMWYAGYTQHGWAYTVNLVEPAYRVDRAPAPFRFRADWDREIVKNLSEKIISTCVPYHAACFIREENETTAVAQLKLQKYIEISISDPSFVEAFGTLMRAAGMSQGANIRMEAVYG